MSYRNRSSSSQSDAPELAGRIHQMYNCPESMDVEFVFPDYTDKRIRAHRVVLAIISPVFNEMFFGTMKTNKTFQVNDCDPSIFQQIIDCAYLKPINLNVPIPDLIRLGELVKKYKIENVIDKIEENFIDRIGIENVCELFETSQMLDMHGLRTHCIDLFTNKTRQILKTKDFLNAKAKTVNFIFGLEELAIASEMELYRALERWVIERHGDELEFFEEVDEAISSIRFLTFDIRDLCDLQLLTADERVALISNKFEEDENFTPIPMPVKLSKRLDKRGQAK